MEILLNLHFFFFKWQPYWPLGDEIGSSEVNKSLALTTVSGSPRSVLSDNTNMVFMGWVTLGKSWGEACRNHLVWLWFSRLHGRILSHGVAGTSFLQPLSYSWPLILCPALSPMKKAAGNSSLLLFLRQGFSECGILAMRYRIFNFVINAPRWLFPKEEAPHIRGDSFPASDGGHHSF